MSKTKQMMAKVWGPGMRKSPPRKWEKDRTSQTVACSKTAVTAAGMNAIPGAIRTAAKVSNADGSKMPMNGTMRKLTGSASKVMRWKYIAIGSAITNSTTRDTSSNSATRSQKL